MRLPSLKNLSPRTVDQERIEVLQVGLSFLDTWTEAVLSVLRKRNRITKMGLMGFNLKSYIGNVGGNETQFGFLRDPSLTLF